MLYDKYFKVTSVTYEKLLPLINILNFICIQILLYYSQFNVKIKQSAFNSLEFSWSYLDINHGSTVDSDH